MGSEKFGVIEENISAVLEINNLLSKVLNSSIDATAYFTDVLTPSRSATKASPSSIIVYTLTFSPLNVGDPQVSLTFFPHYETHILFITRRGGKGWDRDGESSSYIIPSQEWTIKKALENWVSHQPTTIDWVAYFNQGRQEGES